MQKKKSQQWTDQRGLHLIDLLANNGYYTFSVSFLPFVWCTCVYAGTHEWKKVFHGDLICEIQDIGVAQYAKLILLTVHGFLAFGILVFVMPAGLDEGVKGTLLFFEMGYL